MGIQSTRYWNRKWRRIVPLLWLIATAAAAPVIQAAEDPLIIGIFPRNKATETTTMYTPLANYLSERLGRKVVLVTSKDFDSFWKAVMERRYDIVHYNQYHYIQFGAVLQGHRAQPGIREERGRGCALRAQG